MLCTYLHLVQQAARRPLYLMHCSPPSSFDDCMGVWGPWARLEERHWSVGGVLRTDASGRVSRFGEHSTCLGVTCSSVFRLQLAASRLQFDVSVAVRCLSGLQLSRLQLTA